MSAESLEIVDTDAEAPVDSQGLVASHEVRIMRRVVWLMTGILAVSLGVNVFLAYRIGRPKSSAKPSQPAALAVGETVSDLQAQSLDGQPATISYKDSSQPVVLYFFTPQCSWCGRNLANLKALTSLKGSSYKFIAVSLTGSDLKQYLAEKQIGIPVFMNPTDEAKFKYRLGGTPQTIVVSPEGKVLQNWVGAYANSQQAEVEKFFGIALPGLVQ